MLPSNNASSNSEHHASVPCEQESGLSRDILIAEIEELRERNTALADAVVNSAEIIDELEQTKRQLAEARREAEAANHNSRQMAESIFEGTHDAMMVLNDKLEMIASNRHARSIFEIPNHPLGIRLKEHLLSLYQNDQQSDWVDALINASTGSLERLEVFKTQIESVVSFEKHWIEVSISFLESDIADRSYLLTAHDITQRKQIESQLQYQALHDNVTQLPNRRYFIQQVEQLMAQSGDVTFAICFLDLDNFKFVNDTLGHEAGDQLLVEVSSRIQETTRSGSFLARFGGDEFALLIPNQSFDVVESIGRRIVEELKKPFFINENSVYVGASIGVTQFPEDATDVHGLLQNADVAMYSAKEAGRNRFRPFTPELAERVQENQRLLDDLRAALELTDIEMEYQPKWSLTENKLAGCEALLRWKRNGKPVGAAHLVDVAEHSGLILPLGDLVLETALRQMADWRQKHQIDGRIAINISPRQLVDPEFVERFQRIALDSQTPLNQIELEITETAMMENFRQAVERIRTLKELGVSIAIDDFGTGYSSLGYLKSFPVSTLKIDRSFVRDIPNDAKAVAVARAVLSLGHGLGLQVVAEGVETNQQLDFLKTEGCDLVQGYLFSHSLPPAALVEWADEHQGGFPQLRN